MNQIHRDETYGTYHPAPDSNIAWTVNDTRGTINGGPVCDKCGACGCETCTDNACDDVHVVHTSGEGMEHCEGTECVGLSFAYTCLDGGEALCSDCFDKETDTEVVPCNC